MGCWYMHARTPNDMGILRFLPIYGIPSLRGFCKGDIGETGIRISVCTYADIQDFSCMWMMWKCVFTWRSLRRDYVYACMLCHVTLCILLRDASGTCTAEPLLHIPDTGVWMRIHMVFQEKDSLANQHFNMTPVFFDYRDACLFLHSQDFNSRYLESPYM